MTREELLEWVHLLKWHLADTALIIAWQVEDVETKLIGGLTPQDCHEYARSILPPGRRGRVKLVLHTPYEARALSMLVGLLRSYV